MSPLGIRIMERKRTRAIASTIGDRKAFWLNTLAINVLVNHQRAD